MSSLSTGQDYSLLSGHGGSAGVTETNQIRDTTLRLDHAIQFGFGHAVSVGGELVWLDAGYSLHQEASLGLPSPALGDLLETQGTSREMTAYAQDTWRPLAHLVVAPGLRLTHDDLAGATFLESARQRQL